MKTLSIKVRKLSNQDGQFTCAGEEIGERGSSAGEKLWERESVVRVCCAMCALRCEQILHLDRLGRILGDNLEERDDEAQVHARAVAEQFLG